MSAVDELDRGRALAGRGAWLAAHEALASADRSLALQAPDLEQLAAAAYMLGRLEEYVDTMARAHHAYLDAGAGRRAARCAFWIGMQLLLAGEMGRGTGWIGRAGRLVDDEAQECVEQGYMRLPVAFRCKAASDYTAGAVVASDAAAIGRRFGDADLSSLAMHAQGHMLIEGGRVAEGLALLDEAMVAVTNGEVSPIVSGMVYCGVILGCRAAYEPSRAHEWTEALTRWCEDQPDMVAFTGRCHVHRAELMQLKGAWSEALAEARCAADRASRGNHRSALAEAAYLQGEVHRLRGAVREAEDAYRRASECGREPQPGLALLRLARGDEESALAAIRRALAEATDRAARVELLPACAEISLAAGDAEGAQHAADELEAVARDHEPGVLRTIAAQARGAVELAAGRPEAALPPLRRAWRVWEELEAPYEAARARELVGIACGEVGDRASATLDLEAARHAYEALGAVHDVERIDALTGNGPSHGLTARELEVLRLVAQGRTNRQIADELFLSERTIERHVSNTFVKLRVQTRAAATAYAYEHRLL
jgi:DNA-binding CsgD family transcriptional regulator